MGCDTPPSEGRSAYNLVLCNICTELLCLILSCIGTVFGMGFPMLRAAGSLSIVSSIVALSTVSSYPCCCVLGGRSAFSWFIALSLVFCFIAFCLAAAAGGETPCVNQDCFQPDMMFGGTTCTKCEDEGKHDCDPKLSYACSHLLEDFVGEPCANVKYCANWDPDCSKSGGDDDAWFYGFESSDDCEEFHGVGFLRGYAQGLLITASLLTGILRTWAVVAVLKAPKPQGPGTAPAPQHIGMAQNVQAMGTPQVPIVGAVEMVSTPGQPMVLQGQPMQGMNVPGNPPQAMMMQPTPGILLAAPEQPGQNAKML